MHKRFHLLTSLAFFTIGLMVTAAGVRQFRQARDSYSWSMTRGEILSANVGEAYEVDGGYRSVFEVRYAYEVDGRPYESDRFSFGSEKVHNAVTGTQMLEYYHPGRAVDVFFNPDDPSEAVLVTGADGTTRSTVVIGIVLIGLAFVPLYRARTRRPGR